LCRGKIVGESDFTKLGTNEADHRRLSIDLKNLLSEGLISSNTSAFRRSPL
jgi:hypothetical protein